MSKKPTKKTRKKPPVKRIEYEYDPAWDVEPMQLPDGQTMYSCNFKTAEEVAVEKKAEHSARLAAMAATIAAGLASKSLRDPDPVLVLSGDMIVNVSVDLARRILERVEAKP